MTTAIKRRRGTTSQHSTFTGLEGEITIDTTKDTVVVHDGSTAGGFPLAKENNPTFTGTVTIPTADINGGAIDGAVIGGTTPAAGTFTSITTTGNVNFGDNNKAIFGAGSDLQIYHDGSNSFVKDAGTGNLQIQGNHLSLEDSTGTRFLLGLQGGETRIYNQGNEKLAATTTGIDVTGTVTADGLTVEGDVLIDDGVGRITLDSVSGVNRLLSTTTGFGAYEDFEFRADNYIFKTSTSERMRIDSSGQVGIGTSSPATALDVNGTINVRTSGYQFGRITTNNVDTNNGGLTFQTISGGSFSERMRIDSSGNLMVGRTGTALGSETGSIIRPDGVVIQEVNFGGTNDVTVYNQRDGGGTSLISFRNGNVQRGSISWTSSSTFYNTTSDYRLKENVTGITDGIERVKQLNPSRFNFIADADTTVDGFLAHEAATVVPEAVTGEKDAVDADGNPDYQGIDQSKLVPLLTAALQEAITKIEDLEARVATLEGN